MNTNEPKFERAPKDAREIKPKRYPDPITLERYITENGAYRYRIGYLKELADRKGPWREYFEFVAKNLSGDISTMNQHDRKYCDKILDAIVKQRETEYGND